MKRFALIFLAFAGLGAAPVFAQDQAAPETETTASVMKSQDQDDSKKQKKQQQAAQAEARSNGNAYSGRGTREDLTKPDPFKGNASNTSGFTVTKYKESKVQKKLRRGEGRYRLSVPDPKGKPLKHKKKSKFSLFSRR